jgi:hypothetical protein
MRIRNYFKIFTVFVLFLFSFNAFTFAQTANFQAPREQKLLNGLKLLVWETPNAEKTSVKLRIHSGSAFDPQAREGVMALLGEILFPNETVKEYFEQDLGGSLLVESNYDYIQINATADNDKILDLLEALATAVTKPQIDKDTTAKVKTAKLEKLKELEKNPAYIADNAVAKKLFGNYPYGRPQFGTSETLAKLDFADILLAKQKFLNADNATLAVSGGVKFDLVYRAARRLFGGWEKGDKKIPATFTQPDAPDTKGFLTKTDIENTSELRYAFRGLARNDKDFAASQLLIKILQNRLKSQSEKGGFNRQQIGVVRQETRFLPGFVMFRYPNWNVGMIKIEGDKAAIPADTFTFVGDLLKPNVEAAEFETAKNEFLSETGKQNLIDLWLDVDTFKLVSVKDEQQKINNIAIADAQRVLERWRKEPVVTSLVVSSPKS